MIEHLSSGLYIRNDGGIAQISSRDERDGETVAVGVLHERFEVPVQWDGAGRYLGSPEHGCTLAVRVRDTSGEGVGVASLRQRFGDSLWVAAARRLFQDEGTVEVDDGATVSMGEDGAYVQGWVWAADKDADRHDDGKLREIARLRHEQEGLVEVDDEARVSRGDDPGAYVEAWLWVANQRCADCDAGLGVPEMPGDVAVLLCPECEGG